MDEHKLTFLDIFTPVWIVYSILLVLLVYRFVADDAWAWFATVQWILSGVAIIVWKHHAFKPSTKLTSLPIYQTLPVVVYSTMVLHIFAIAEMHNQYNNQGSEFAWIFIVLLVMLMALAGCIGWMEDGKPLHQSLTSSFN